MVGELRLNGFMTHNYSGRLIISQSGKELDSQSLSGDLSTLTLPIREVGVLTFRLRVVSPTQQLYSVILQFLERILSECAELFAPMGRACRPWGLNSGSRTPSQ